MLVQGVSPSLTLTHSTNSNLLGRVSSIENQTKNLLNYTHLMVLVLAHQ